MKLVLYFFREIVTIQPLNFDIFFSNLDAIRVKIVSSSGTKMVDLVRANSASNVFKKLSLSP
jgi:hypothetical protein